MNSLTVKQNYIPPMILGVFLISFAFWIYLSITTVMIISCDALDYQRLGRLLQTQGFMAYFQTGPNREPLYPLLVYFSMLLETWSGLAFTKIMAGFGMIILFLTQILTFIILKKLNVRAWICALILLYLGFSPALNNSAFSLYSEIATYPITLGIVLSSYSLWKAIKEDRFKKILILSSVLGILLTAATLSKAIFECFTPVYLIIFVLFTILQNRKNNILFPLLCVIVAGSLFYTLIFSYKKMNQEANGNFAITNRAAWALYGNTARRLEPLTSKRFLSALAYAPGEGICYSFFNKEDCAFWSFTQSDLYGLSKNQELNQQKLPAAQIDATLIRLSKEMIITNPLQYLMFMVIEGSKLFFWESTQIGFVGYSPSLTKLYDIKILNNLLRLFMALLTIWAVAVVWMQSIKSTSHPLMNFTGLFIFIFIFFYSFFFILTRYAFPIVPLYLICIGFSLNLVVTNKKRL